MRVAMFMPELVPGALGSLIYRDLAAAFRSQGHSFDCLVTEEPRDAHGDGWMKRLPLSESWRRLGSAARPLLRTRALFAYAAALASYLRKEGRDLDVLHIEIAYPTGAAAALAVAASGWRGFRGITPMGEDVLVAEEAFYGFRRYPAPRALVSWTLRRAGVIRCISPLIRDLVNADWPQTPAETIPLNVAGAALELLAEPLAARLERRRRARQALQSRHRIGEGPVIVALGRLHPFKGIDVLVEALASLPDAQLLVAGPSMNVRPYGDVATRLAALAEALRVGDRIRFLGAIAPADALDLLSGADVVAVPSRLESMNRVCVEAAAAGTPFVATETTGVTGWIPGDGVGVVVPAGDARALAVGLNQILRGGWQADGEATATFVRQFSPDRVAEALVGMYARWWKPSAL